MSHRVRNAHAVLPEQFELSIEFWIIRCQHSTFASRYDFARVKGEAGDSSACLANPLPLSVYANFTAGGTGGIFNQYKIVLTCQCTKRDQIACHSHLINNDNTARAIRDRRSNTIGVEIVCCSVNICKYGCSAAVADTVSRRNERMACGDDFITRSNTRCDQCQMKRGCTI